MTTIRLLACIVLLSWPTGATAEEQRTVYVPANIGIHDSVRPTLERSAARSPTLQRQFEAIASARARVDVLVSPAPRPSFRRAETIISRYEGGFIKAEIVVPPGPDFFELLAHELEHVVEQIDGVDLAMLIRTGEATRDGRGVIETGRARRAGLAAASEIAAGGPALHVAP